MSSISADYTIAAIRYDLYRSRIEHVWVINRQGVAEVLHRTEVISLIKLGHRFTTAPHSSLGYQYPGAIVHVVLIFGYEYIRTDANHTAQDNLGSLPEF